MHVVSDINLEKVEKFLIKQVKETGSREIRLRVDEIAFGANVALATGHKALKALAQEGIIKITRDSNSRRFSNIYHFIGDIDYEEKKFSLEEKIRMQDNRIRELMDRITSLKSENNRLRQMLYGKQN